MASVDDAEVELGDLIRDKEDDWEGEVIEVTEEHVVLRMHTGTEREVPLVRAKRNDWDPKKGADKKPTVEDLEATIAEQEVRIADITETVEFLVQDALTRSMDAMAKGGL